MPFNLSFAEVLVLLLVALLVFGGRLPEVARKFGGAISEFKRGMRDEMRRVERDLQVGETREWQRPPTSPPPAPAAPPAAPDDEPTRPGP